MEKYIIINRGFAVYWAKCTMKCGQAVIYVQDLEPCIFLDKPAGSYRIDYEMCIRDSSRSMRGHRCGDELLPVKGVEKYRRL